MYIKATKKCETRSEFTKSSAGVIAKRNGWLEVMADSLPPMATRPNNYWTLERCIEAAKKCEIRSEFWATSARRIVGSGQLKLITILKICSTSYNQQNANLV